MQLDFPNSSDQQKEEEHLHIIQEVNIPNKSDSIRSIDTSSLLQLLFRDWNCCCCPGHHGSSDRDCNTPVPVRQSRKMLL
jgi:hypothetical protein